MHFALSSRAARRIWPSSTGTADHRSFASW